MQYLRAVYLFLGLLLTFTTLLSAQTEYKYSYVPKKVYENQLFPVTIIGINTSNKEMPKFNFDHTASSQALFNKPLVIRNGNDSFYTFYFQAKKDDVQIPSLTIDVSRETYRLESQNIMISTLKKRDDFCNVLAADMNIKTSQVSNYDEYNLIVTLSIEAFEANIEDMELNNTIESGVEHIVRNFAKVEAEFYVVVPATQKVLKFTYFNSIKKQYVFLEVPVVVADASVSTQSDLNPKEDSFEKLKKYTLMTFSIFFVLMFLFRRDFFYLVFAVISVITLLTLYIPHKKICVSQGAPLYILPTQTSTISTKIDTELDTLLLGKRKGYKKVEYKEGIIGWIKNEDLCNY
ncbi:MAG: hypothetical protein GQ531_01705 [Sulfurovum sp.]|nr:hypothetical protein [Sulfurovum sp.]